ncbi:MAG: hypothetical protein ACREJQ_03455, partial [bacterium]
MAMGEAREKMKRPLGIKVTALMILLLGLLFLFDIINSTIDFLNSSDITFIFMIHFGIVLQVTLPPLFCLTAMLGIFYLKPWGRWLALALAVYVGYLDYGYFSSADLFSPWNIIVDIREVLTNLAPISAQVVMWSLFLLPFVTVYFLVFDKATVAAFRKAPP